MGIEWPPVSILVVLSHVLDEYDIWGPYTYNLNHWGEVYEALCVQNGEKNRYGTNGSKIATLTH